MRRAGRGVAKALGRFFQPHFERLPARHGLALRRNERREPASQGPACEILVGLRRRHPRDAALDAHLALQLRPAEKQHRLRVFLELTALAAAVVRVEDEAERVEALQQHGTRRRTPLFRGGRERHRVGQSYTGLQGLVEPAAELRERIRVEILLLQTGTHVFLTEGSEIHCGNSTTYLRRRAYKPPRESRSAVAQNTGSMPSAVPSAPNRSGIAIWLMLTRLMRTPIASPTRPAGAVLWSRDMTIGCDIPSPRPSRKATAIRKLARSSNGNRKKTVAAVPRDTVRSGHALSRRDIAGRSPRMTKVATENEPSTRPMLDADNPMREP